MATRPQQQPIPFSQFAQDVFAQTGMIHQDDRKNAMQAYTKNKAYFFLTKRPTIRRSKKRIM